MCLQSVVGKKGQLQKTLCTSITVVRKYVSVNCVDVVNHLSLHGTRNVKEVLIPRVNSEDHISDPTECGSVWLCCELDFREYKLLNSYKQTL